MSWKQQKAVITLKYLIDCKSLGVLKKSENHIMEGKESSLKFQSKAICVCNKNI